MEAIGFTGNDMYSMAQCHSVYYRKVPSKCRVDVVTAYGAQTVSQFQLTKAQFRAFENNKLGLVPPGCCSASGRRCLDNPVVLFEGEIVSIKHITRILQDALPLKTNVKPFAGSNTPRRRPVHYKKRNS